MSFTNVFQTSYGLQYYLREPSIIQTSTSYETVEIVAFRSHICRPSSVRKCDIEAINQPYSRIFNPTYSLHHVYLGHVL